MSFSRIILGRFKNCLQQVSVLQGQRDVEDERLQVALRMLRPPDEERRLHREVQKVRPDVGLGRRRLLREGAQHR